MPLMGKGLRFSPPPFPILGIHLPIDSRIKELNLKLSFFFNIILKFVYKKKLGVITDLFFDIKMSR